MNELELLKRRIEVLESELQKRKIQQISFPLDDISLAILSEKMSLNKQVSAPTTTSAGPVNDRYGGASTFLGNPNNWVELTLPGIGVYKVPLYS